MQGEAAYTTTWGAAMTSSEHIYRFSSRSPELDCLLRPALCFSPVLRLDLRMGGPDFSIGSVWHAFLLSKGTAVELRQKDGDVLMHMLSMRSSTTPKLTRRRQKLCSRAIVNTNALTLRLAPAHLWFPFRVPFPYTSSLLGLAPLPPERLGVELETS